MFDSFVKSQIRRICHFDPLLLSFRPPPTVISTEGRNLIFSACYGLKISRPDWSGWQAEETFYEFIMFDSFVKSRSCSLFVIPCLTRNPVFLSSYEFLLSQEWHYYLLFTKPSQLEPSNYLPFLFGASSSEDTSEWLYQAIERNPYSLKARVLLGEEYVKRGNIQGSFKCFESAAESFPEYEIPYLRNASLLQKLGHKNESKHLIEKGKALVTHLLW